jgi:hypothetical protein
MEHFVTLFDSNFLPMGLCLHRSLSIHGGNFRLWIICMDGAVEESLRRMALPNVSLIPLRDVEDDRLLAVKPGRGRGEYCWTLTPFATRAVLDRDSTATRATYVDADLCFFASPQPLFDEFERSGKDVLITEHAYDPRYAGKARRGGRFCVQFITCRRTPGADHVMRWWQDRCLEWCFARVEDGKYGDQKYLDSWPELFGPQVHILEQKEKTLAPWNVRYYLAREGASHRPAFYHFHGLRITSPLRVLLYSGYDIGPHAPPLYQAYVDSLGQSIRQMKALGLEVPVLPLAGDLASRLLRWKRRVINGEGEAVLSPAAGN